MAKVFVGDVLLPLFVHLFGRYSVDGVRGRANGIIAVAAPVEIARELDASIYARSSGVHYISETYRFNVHI